LFLPSFQTKGIKIATKVFNFLFTADVLLSEITPRVLRHVRSFLSSNIDSVVADVFEPDTGSEFWLKMIEAIKDPYAVERMSELLLHRLAAEHASDVEAYWILWLLFHRTFRHQTSVRSVSTLPS
jgi:telomere length regulation protein